MPASPNRVPRPLPHLRLPIAVHVRGVVAAAAFLLILGAAHATAAAATVPGPGPATGGDSNRVSFARDIAPLLATKCLACHQPSKAKSNYRLHTPAALVTAGRTGDPPIVAGKPDQSPVYRLLLATDPDDRMPKDDDPLPPGQIALIRRWIEQGARTDGFAPDQSIAGGNSGGGSAPDRYPRPVPILALAFSPTGTELAIGGYHEILIRNSGDGTLARRVGGLARQIQSIAFSPDGRRLALASGTPGRAGEAVVLDGASGTILLRAGAAGDLMTSVAFSPDGRRLALGGADNTLRVIDADSGRVLFRSEHHADWILDVTFDGLGEQILTTSRDKTVRLVSSATGRLEETYAGHGGAVFAALFSPDGRRVVSAGRDRELHLWQASDGRKLGGSGPVPDEILRLARAGRRIIAGLANGEIREFRMQEKSLKETRVWGSHGDGLSALAVRLETSATAASKASTNAPAGSANDIEPKEREPAGRVATAGHDGRVRIWDLGTAKTVREFPAFPGLESP